jgi:hypothetical protein
MNIERDPCLTASPKEANFRRRSWIPPASDLVPYRTVLCTRHLHQQRNFARASDKRDNDGCGCGGKRLRGSTDGGEGKREIRLLRFWEGNVGSTCKGTKKMNELIANRGG